MERTRRIRNSVMTIAPASVLVAAAISALSAICYIRDAGAGTESTKHNLSTSGPGPVKATTETQICVFCHTPHGATSLPLWNRRLSQASYVVPSTATHPTMLSAPQNPPDGDSRLCLSCHDGTVAIGEVVNLGGAPSTITMAQTEYLTGAGMLSSESTAMLGINISGHHPVSIEVNMALLNDKNTQCINNEVAQRVCLPQPPVKLRPTDNRYGAGGAGLGVQCSSCHDPHNDPIPGVTKFLRAGTKDDSSELCSNCHLLCSEACP